MHAVRFPALALAAACALSSGAAFAQASVREQEVRRPDGSVVLPMPAEDRGRVQQPRANSGIDAENLERRWREAEQQRWERAEKSRIERDAARESPVRQSTPTQRR